MTTAHRPTWHAALGGEGAGGNRLAVDSRKVGGRDLPGHRELKTRHDLPTEAEAAPGELKAQLLQSEAKRRTAIANKSTAPFEASKTLGTSSEPSAEPNPFPEDADDYPAAADGADDDDDSEDSDGEEEAELMRELERIRKTRAEDEKKKRDADDAARKEEARVKALRSNPIIMGAAEDELGGPLKRRWDDDVVFKQQAKKETKSKKVFVNDAVRSDFHRKFLAKYIQ
eukprot:GHVT01101267.1.p1 GENE.GHVT01101267.1~~GHVT01101267.1.p1  ORF type:complete len:228 (-),score=82.59 GHVT01101267.1:599-1282(-)